jgi:endonuclease/exonuclease/phosphatase (EEP) superfamily protein YafD
MPMNQSVYRVKLHLSLSRGILMSICSSSVYQTPEIAVPKRSITQRFRLLLQVFLILIALWVTAAYLLPQKLTDTGGVYSVAVCLSFVARVLRFHLAIATVAIGTLALLLRSWRTTLCALPLSIVLLWPTITSYLPKHPAPAAGPTVRLMSMNLMFNNRNANAIVDQIRQADPDIVAIQEYTQFADELLPRELADYPYRLTDPDDNEDPRGMALFSRIPMQAELQHMNGSIWRRQIRASLLIDGKPVVLYDIHPASPQSMAAIMRNRVETADLIGQFQQEHDPLIVVGDFNATPQTPNLHAYESLGLCSTHDLAGIGRGTTWPDVGLIKHLPGFRIDHILLGQQLTCTEDHVGGPTGSDHRPIIADIAYSRN